MPCYESDQSSLFWLYVAATAHDVDHRDWRPENKKSVKSVRDDTNNFQWFILIITAFSLVIGATFSVLTIRKLLQILGGEAEAAAEVIKKIANGDLSVTVQASSPNSVMGSLQELNRQLNQSPRLQRSNQQLLQKLTRTLIVLRIQPIWQNRRLAK